MAELGRTAALGNPQDQSLIVDYLKCNFNILTDISNNIISGRHKYTTGAYLIRIIPTPAVLEFFWQAIF